MPSEEITKQDTYYFMSRYIDSRGNEIRCEYDDISREDVFKHLLFVVSNVKIRFDLACLYKANASIYSIVDYADEYLRKNRSDIHVNISMMNSLTKKRKVYVTTNGEERELEQLGQYYVSFRPGRQIIDLRNIEDQRDVVYCFPIEREDYYG